MKEMDNEDSIKENFGQFAKVLASYFSQNNGESENNKLELFLQAFFAWTVGMKGYYQNQIIPFPKNLDCTIFVNIILAATIYG